MIGIISWLHPSHEIRDARFKKTIKLLQDLTILFKDENIVVVGQDYTTEKVADVEAISNKINVHCFEKLGITGARNKLREIFLTTNEEYLIMYDDDCELTWGNDTAGSIFIETLKISKYGYVTDRVSLLKNAGVMRNILENIKFRLGDHGEDYYQDARFYRDLVEYLALAPQQLIQLHRECSCLVIQDRSLTCGEPYRTYKKFGEE